MDEPIDATVLIVDDNAYDRELVVELAHELGAQTREASDGRAAIQSITAMPPDLVLTDVNMPYMDGVECCRWIKSNPATQFIPVVIITTLDGLQDRVRGIDAGADEFLAKPVRAPELQARMRSLLRSKRLLETLESAENVIYALAKAIEAKDLYTNGHTERVTAYAVELGKAIGCSEDEQLGLKEGGILHDVGKIGVPDHILNKAGKLTPNEFKIVTRHPLIGYTICAPLKSLAKSLPCVRWHHEKLDGSGYPDGLKGPEIPKSSRIMAIADIYDALTTRRSYKDAMPQEKANEILLAEAASNHLDSELVKVFIEKHAQVPEVC